MYKICRRNESWYIVIKKNEIEIAGKQVTTFQQIVHNFQRIHRDAKALTWAAWIGVERVVVNMIK